MSFKLTGRGQHPDQSESPLCTPGAVRTRSVCTPSPICPPGAGDGDGTPGPDLPGGTGDLRSDCAPSRLPAPLLKRNRAFLRMLKPLERPSCTEDSESDAHGTIII